MVAKRIQEYIDLRQKVFCVLIDPDKFTDDGLIDLVNITNKSKVHFFFVGGSLMTSPRFERTIKLLKSISDIPVVIFPGSNQQVSKEADAILLLSLISGRNPDYLIGQHVVAAPYLKESGIEILPTGYMLIGSKNDTTANYMSNTFPIPPDKDEIAMCTAMAGEMLGLKLIYMDGGSGAGSTIDPEMIRRVKSAVQIPLIIGGGITSAEKAHDICEAGADMIVVGNGIETRLELISEISAQLDSVS